MYYYIYMYWFNLYVIYSWSAQSKSVAGRRKTVAWPEISNATRTFTRYASYTTTPYSNYIFTQSLNNLIIGHNSDGCRIS